MALQEIIATFSCDECGKPFRVGIDPSMPIPERSDARPSYYERKPLTAFDVAVNTVAGGPALYDGPCNPDGSGCCSVRGDRHLCGVCSGQADEAEEL